MEQYQTVITVLSAQQLVQNVHILITTTSAKNANKDMA